MEIYLEARRQFAEDRMRVERRQRRQRQIEAQLKLAIDLYIAHVTAPWQALANHIRSELPT